MTMKREVPASHGARRDETLHDRALHDLALDDHALHDHAAAHAHTAVAGVLHALAEPSRLSMIHLLADAPRRVVDLTRALGLAQSTVSAHLAVLRAAGLVATRPEGRATWYALADREVDELLGAAERVVSRAAERVASPADGTQR